MSGSGLPGEPRPITFPLAKMSASVPVVKVGEAAAASLSVTAVGFADLAVQA